MGVESRDAKVGRDVEARILVAPALIERLQSSLYLEADSVNDVLAPHRSERLAECSGRRHPRATAPNSGLPTTLPGAGGVGEILNNAWV